MTDMTCPKCQQKFNSLDLKSLRCRECRTWLNWDEVDPQSMHELSKESAKEPAIRELTDNDQLIAAQDRTTYAIRSLAIFFFITLCTSLLGYGLVGAGAASAIGCNSSYSDCGSSGLVIGGWAIIVIGFIAALILSISELSKSRP